MELTPLISIAQILLGGIFLLVCANLYLVFRLKEIDPFANWNPNKINAGLFVFFWIAFLVLATVGSIAYSDRMIFMHEAASAHGQDIDTMMFNTTLIAILVVLVTGTLLFYFSWRYQHREGEKALFYPHNNRLELIWTLVPAVVMTVLVINGFFVWKNTMIDEPPANAIQLEMTGEQFRWTARYPGGDLKFGEAHVSFIDGGINTLGMNFKDIKGHDDLIVDPTGGDIYLPVGLPVVVNIRSKDVLHSMTLAHFRVKMDAVPGMTTKFSFTPLYTTEQWREKTGNDKFDYEMSCQQICGSSHYNMRRVVKIVEMDEYQSWLASQKPFYALYKELNPDAAAASVEPASPSIQETAAETPVEEGAVSMN